MNEVEFWNDQDAAQKTIAQFKLLKAQTDALGTVIPGFRGCTGGL